MSNQSLDQIIVDDCLEVLAQIPDDSVDVCFADPPFNLKKKYTSYDDRKALNLCTQHSEMADLFCRPFESDCRFPPLD